jgi:hypothetical protein
VVSATIQRWVGVVDVLMASHRKTGRTSRESRGLSCQPCKSPAEAGLDQPDAMQSGTTIKLVGATTAALSFQSTPVGLHPTARHLRRA